jgi:TorA-specific chaperone
MMSEVVGSRDEVYGMLARLFIGPPNEELLESILGYEVDVDTERLAVDFTELLRGLRQSSPPPPYESLYREGVIHGESTQQVIEAYHAFGVHPSGELEGEPADHISLELDFMRHLVTLEADAGNAEELMRILRAEDEFLGEHLCLWVGGLSERIGDQDDTGFYSSVVSFTDAWVMDDLRRVRERLGAGEVAP